MILLVDSGSSKTDWLWVQSNGTVLNSFKTMGFNPYFHSSEFIQSEIAKNTALAALSEGVKYIFYYGAGCSSTPNQELVQTALGRVFPRATVMVRHDMAAAAFATYEGEPMIACILGTGSNAAYFDGNSLHSVNSGLGYILGDEGSGTWFGKKLLAAYLYGQLPVEIGDELRDEFGLTRENILHRVYEESHANVYLAGFTPFISRHRNHPVFKEMLVQGMHDFLRLHVCCYPNFDLVRTHFVGSVAYHLSEPLKEAASRLKVNVGQILQAPIERLLEYHTGYIFPKLSEVP